MNTTSIEQLYALYQQYPSICTDTRKIIPNALFFALKGDNFDGNTFAESALAQGAAYCIIDNPSYQINDKCLLVSDVLVALQQLARHHRRQFDIPIIGITGSNGKTTTKELVSAVLESHYDLHYTKGNFNNHIGVPLTLLAMPANTEVAVIEMGANHQGEIAELCLIAEPTHGLITNVGKAHLEGMGGFEGVKKTKAELYQFLAANKGLAFVNKDEAHLSDMAINNDKKLFYTQSNDPNPDTVPIEVKLLESSPMVSAAFLSDGDNLLTVHSNLVGMYNFNNIMTAIALGKYFKVPANKIKAAIEDYVPSNNRSQLEQRGSNMLILDAYNANPTSMRNALQNFHGMKGAKKIAILGDMLEMGEYSQSEHEAILAQALAMELDELILVGKEFGKIADRKAVTYFTDSLALKTYIDSQNYQDTTFLIKGSRGIQLEKGIIGL